jgi:GDP-4-dehydro-6-deoxy-D-mannose reductase
LLTKKNIQVYGIDHPAAGIKNIYQIRKELNFAECDITKSADLKRILKDVRPQVIYHLAAQSNSQASLKTPINTINTNIIGELNLFEALRSLKHHPRILIAGSCEEYGLVKKGQMPIKEDAPLRPRNIYAITKVAQDFLGYQYYKNSSFDVIRARPFNHTGPRQSEAFVCSSLARQVALIEKKRKRPILHAGNLNIKRDFTDVRDVARAYWLLAEKGISGEAYNICSQKAYSIKEIADIFLSLTGVKIKIECQKARARSNDMPILLGDCTKLKKATGWRPQILFKKTLQDLLDYWRSEF